MAGIDTWRPISGLPRSPTVIATSGASNAPRVQMFTVHALTNDPWVWHAYPGETPRWRVFKADLSLHNVITPEAEAFASSHYGQDGSL